MNFFFGIKTGNFYSKINIPKFNNDGKLLFNNYSIYQCVPEENSWKISSVKCGVNNEFFFIDKDQIDNNKIFFISNEDQLKNKQAVFNVNELKNFNPVTDKNVVEFRSNLKVCLLDGGVSSYQSEYSYKMTLRKGSILSPLDVLLNKNADENYIIFRNIHVKPLIESYFMYLINKDKKKVVERFEIKSNTTNLIKIKNKYLGLNLYLFTKDILGIPLYLSIKEKHMSMEHTHPPMHYLFGPNAFKAINNVKKEFEIIVNEKFF